MISLPLQTNTNFGIGPYDRTGEVFNVQPVVPLPLGSDWNLVAGYYNVGTPTAWSADWQLRVQLTFLFPR